MAIKLLRAGFVGSRVRFSIEESDHERVLYANVDPGRPLCRSYQYRGRKVRNGSFWTATSEADIWRLFLRAVRKHFPKARIHVTWCSECRTGSAPDLPCKHEQGAQSWILHEGRPSWHQARAGHISAGGTIYDTKEAAERGMERFRKARPDESFFITEHWDR